MTLGVAVYGAAGRMGRTVIKLVQEATDLSLIAAVDADGSAQVGRDAGQLAGVSDTGVRVESRVEALLEADVVVDFSLARALPRLFEVLERKHVPLVLATTGLDDTLATRLAQLARVQPLVAAGNYSTGVAVLCYLAERASALLPYFDLEIIELHHRNKIDAPSGTAQALLDAAARGRNEDGRELAVHGRHGHTGARSQREIGVVSLRGGDVIGDHTLLLAGPGERLELTHRAGNRELFAQGALRAARWVVNKPPGRYGMAEVLGLPGA